MVLLAAFSSDRSNQACAREPAPEGARRDNRGCCASQRQRHNECVGVAAARIGDDLAARPEQLALAGFVYSPAKGTGSSEAPLTATPTAGTAKAPTSSAKPSSVTA